MYTFSNPTCRQGDLHLNSLLFQSMQRIFPSLSTKAEITSHWCAWLLWFCDVLLIRGLVIDPYRTNQNNTFSKNSSSVIFSSDFLHQDASSLHESQSWMNKITSLSRLRMDNPWNHNTSVSGKLISILPDLGAAGKPAHSQLSRCGNCAYKTHSSIPHWAGLEVALTSRGQWSRERCQWCWDQFGSQTLFTPWGHKETCGPLVWTETL